MHILTFINTHANKQTNKQKHTYMYNTYHGGHLGLCS